MNKILVVDDEESVRYSFFKLLRAPDYQVTGVHNGPGALEKIKQDPPDLVILDIEMPGMSGLEVLQQIKHLAPRIPVLIITAYGSGERVITAMKYGAYEYLEKPFDIPRMRALIDEALGVGRLMKEAVLIEPGNITDWSGAYIIGNSPAIKEVFKMIGRVSASDVSILLVGESGTGKELVARAIHQHSNRSAKLFLTVNCAAIPDTLLESELFGYEKGAFTGAVKRKAGKFEQAHNGTLFLDEIGDMNPAIQAKLLRVLQEGTFERLGGSETLYSNVRIIAATNKNLEEAIANKEFREDLYYRLKVITIALPPLRTRKEDIPELANFFLAKHRAQLNKPDISLAADTLEELLKYDWPGNVRELENVLKRAVLLCKSDVITGEIIATEVSGEAAAPAEGRGERLSSFIPGELEAYHGRLYQQVMEEVEKELILAALQAMEGNQVKTARLLGISRVMLHDRIEKYGIKSKTVIKED